MRSIGCWCFLFLIWNGPSWALEPKDVFLIVNKNVPASKEIADLYIQKRSVPAENVITLDLPKEEDISRKDYNEKLVGPLREALKGREIQVKVLLSIYGVPLRVGGDGPSEEERAELKKTDATHKERQDQIQMLEAEIKKGEAEKKSDPPGANEEKLKEQRKELQSLRDKQNRLNQQRSFLNHAESHAAVDSELMLLWWEKYELRRWQINLNYFQVPAQAREGKKPVLMTCRLDGPTPEIVRRMLKDSLEVEKEGLKGKVYVDARGIRLDKNDIGYGYGGYDESMREMAALLKEAGKLDVTLDDKDALFPVGSCTDCALYCGWYSHANFIDCCKFVPGAVAWHLASSEAVSLRRPDAKYWCKNQLEKGAAATLGPVGEPYTIGFPKPAEFFGLLATGKYTLVECYCRTVLFSSWMGTLIGDPLYNPYAKNPRLPEDAVKPSPKAGRFLLREEKKEEKKEESKK